MDNECRNAIEKLDLALMKVREEQKAVTSELARSIDELKLKGIDMTKFVIALRKSVLADITAAQLEFDKGRFLAALKHEAQRIPNDKKN